MLPQALRPGDTIGIIAPASPPNMESFRKSLSFFYDLELKIKQGKQMENVHGYLAGRDEERLEDLHEMFADPSIKGIICAGGGYGTGRIADKIDYQLIRNNPKIFWGYSDITYLHTAIKQETGLTTFHGPMPASDIGDNHFHEKSARSFHQLFEPTPLVYDESFSSLTVLSEGEAAGEIVGGNLSLIVNSMGGPYELDTKEKLLFIEDINEEPYRVDSFLNQLHHAGKLRDAAGIIVGDFNNPDPKRNPSLSLEDVFNHYLKPLQKPVMKGFKIGHCQPHFSIPLGTNARLSTSKKTLSIDPGVVDSVQGTGKHE